MGVNPVHDPPPTEANLSQTGSTPHAVGFIATNSAIFSLRLKPNLCFVLQLKNGHDRHDQSDPFQRG